MEELVGRFVCAYWACGAVHEFAHLAVAAGLGRSRGAWHWRNMLRALFARQVDIPMAAECKRCRELVRHAGWIASLLFAGAVWRFRAGREIVAAAALTAAEALASDLLAGPEPLSDRFFCGNFGMLLLDAAWGASDSALLILQRMAEVTMMRGAQAGGVVSFVRAGFQADAELEGVRSRVVNSKRGDLSERIVARVRRRERNILGFRSSHLIDHGRIYAGHTRFATTSKATLDGTHPHVWTPPRRVTVWSGLRKTDPQSERAEKVVVNYICHNGDFDFLRVGSRLHELDAIQPWLERVLEAPIPSFVDSCALAGVIDLLRARGSWELATRCAFHFDLDRNTLEVRARARFARSIPSPLAFAPDVCSRTEPAPVAASPPARLRDMRRPAPLAEISRSLSGACVVRVGGGGIDSTKCRRPSRSPARRCSSRTC